MSNYLIHSAKGTEWKNTKYVSKEPDGHGGYRYTYASSKPTLKQRVNVATGKLSRTINRRGSRYLALDTKDYDKRYTISDPWQWTNQHRYNEDTKTWDAISGQEQNKIFNHKRLGYEIKRMEKQIPTETDPVKKQQLEYRIQRMATDQAKELVDSWNTFKLASLYNNSKERKVDKWIWDRIKHRTRGTRKFERGAEHYLFNQGQYSHKK